MSIVTCRATQNEAIAGVFGGTACETYTLGIATPACPFVAALSGVIGSGLTFAFDGVRGRRQDEWSFNTFEYWRLNDRRRNGCPTHLLMVLLLTGLWAYVCYKFPRGWSKFRMPKAQAQLAPDRTSDHLESEAHARQQAIEHVVAHLYPTGEELADAWLTHSADSRQLGLGDAGLQHHLTQHLAPVGHATSIANFAIVATKSPDPCLATDWQHQNRKVPISANNAQSRKPDLACCFVNFQLHQIVFLRLSMCGGTSSEPTGHAQTRPLSVRRAGGDRLRRRPMKRNLIVRLSFSSPLPLKAWTDMIICIRFRKRR